MSASPKTCLSDEEKVYFTALVKRLGAPVVVEWGGESRGRIARATCDVPAGTLMWTEEPLVTQRDVDSLADVWSGRSCERCMRPLGSARSQLARYRALVSRFRVFGITFVGKDDVG